LIKYLGSKRTLVPLIEQVAAELPVRTACDLFAGTTRVGQALRGQGLRVVSNDTASYSEAFGQAYVVADARVDRLRIRRLLARLNALPGRAGYFTHAFCEQARYLRPENGARVDAIRAEIDALSLSEVERGILLTALVEAADRVDSTVGLQMAYLKRWAPRALNPLELREPHAVAGPAGSVARGDANALAPALDVDLAYVDPPYNQHSYFSNYHVWETLVRGDEPETYGVANKRVDCRERKSAWNSRRRAAGALEDLLERIAAPWLIVSFNAEGFHDPDAVEERLSQRGHVARLPVGVRRYVGAQIGIHAPSGEKVGRVSHLRTTEYLFVAGPDRAIVERAAGLRLAAA
jgi:adenine-specific DNA-methyltransferase